MLDIIDKGLLKAVADLNEIPQMGAYNIRKREAFRQSAISFPAGRGGGQGRI